MATVHAAGGVLWRPAAAGVEVCLVHRPRYDDWSLPKGKLERGEHPLAAAVREVREETGTVGVPQLRLPSVGYPLPDGADKHVDFWSMRADGGPPGDRDDEADEVVWLCPATALERLSYPDDRRVLGDFAGRPAVTAVVLLVRHARAGKRQKFPGPDGERPLDPDGRHQARALATVLAAAGPCRLVSATPRRCVDTLGPLADRLDRTIEVDAAFDEPTEPAQAPGRAAVAADRLAELAGAEPAVVVCSQGRLMPDLLTRLAGRGTPADYRTPKGTGWLLAYAGSAVVGMDRIAPAAPAKD